jgi:hypothetical protein
MHTDKFTLLLIRLIFVDICDICIGCSLLRFYLTRRRNGNSFFHVFLGFTRFTEHARYNIMTAGTLSVRSILARQYATKTDPPVLRIFHL